MAQPCEPARLPTVASTRPQLGSAPKSEAFTSGDWAMARATSRAASSLGAPATTTSQSLVAPSPSAAMARAISPSRSVRAASKRARSGDGSARRGLPARPLASTSTVSLVDISPSTVSMLKVWWTARTSTSCSVLGATAASVVTMASVVASCGASIPEPLAMQAMVAVLPPSTSSREASLRRVSVVMMASAARSAWSPSSSTSPGSAVTTFMAGSRTPMTPVEAVSTARFCTPSRSATAPRITATSSSPPGPVRALALPELATTARIPSAGTRPRASRPARRPPC